MFKFSSRLSSAGVGGERAVEAVAPGVIRTGEASGGRSSRSVHTDARPAVAADVQQGANIASRSADDDEGFGSEVDGQIIADVRDAAHMAGAEPMAQQHALHVLLEDGRIRVELPGQRMPRLLLADQALEVGVVVGADSGDGVGFAGDAPGFEDLGVFGERVRDLVELGWRQKPGAGRVAGVRSG